MTRPGLDKPLLAYHTDVCFAVSPAGGPVTVQARLHVSDTILLALGGQSVLHCVSDTGSTSAHCCLYVEPARSGPSVGYLNTATMFLGQGTQVRCEQKNWRRGGLNWQQCITGRRRGVCSVGRRVFSGGIFLHKGRYYLGIFSALPTASPSPCSGCAIWFPLLMY